MSVALSRTFPPFLAPSLPAGFQARHPEATCRFIEESQLNLEHAMLAGNIDLSVIYDLDVGPGFERLRLYDAEAYILVSPQHRLGDTTAPVDLALFGDDPSIQIDVLPGRNDHLFAAIGITPNIVDRTTNFEFVRALVADNLGYAALVRRPKATSPTKGCRWSYARSPTRSRSDGRPRLAGQPAFASPGEGLRRLHRKSLQGRPPRLIATPEKRATLNPPLTAGLHGFLPDGRFPREIGEGMTPRLYADAESDMSTRQTFRTRFRSRRCGVTPCRSRARHPCSGAQPCDEPASAGVSGSAMKGRVAMLRPDFGGDAKRVLKALDRSLAIVEFEPNGKIIAANENFCRLLGYELPEIEGKHHSLFVDPDDVRSPDYKEFWAKLGRG